MVAVANPSGAGLTAIPNGALPCEGTKAFPFTLDFTTTNAYLFDLTQQFNQKQFTTLQTVYIDNSNNGSRTDIVCNGTGQVISAPPFTQGYYDILQPTPQKFAVQSAGNVAVGIQLLNFYIPPAVWTFPPVSAGGLPEVDIPALDAIIVGGLLQTQTTPSTTSAMTDGSGTIAAAGTKQVLFAANAARKRLIVSNPGTATEQGIGAAEDLGISFNGTAGDGIIWLAPNQIFDDNGTSVVGDGVWIVAATIAHKFTAYTK